MATQAVNGDELDFAQGFRAGFDAGYESARQELIGWLEMRAKAMRDPNWPSQGSPLGWAPRFESTPALVAELHRRATSAESH